MRLLLVSDVHGSLDRVAALSRILDAFDLVLVAGDVTEFGGEEEARELLAPLLASGLPLAAVAGNCDRVGARRYLEASGVSVEGRARRLGALSVAGTGGGSYRTGLTPFERREEELRDALLAALRSREGPGPLVILSHAPAWGTEADLRRGQHVGSPALRAILDEWRPLLWASGHIHEARSVSRCGASLVVNPGALHDGYYARVELDPVGTGTAEAWLEEL